MPTIIEKKKILMSLESNQKCEQNFIYKDAHSSYLQIVKNWKQPKH